MKLKAAVKYNLNETKNTMIIYYLVMYAILITTTMLGSVFNQDIRISGIEFSSIIILFVIGLNMFKTQFKFLIQNGISRKTKFLGFLVSTIIVLPMAIIDSINSVLINYVIEYESFFEMLAGVNITGFNIEYMFKSTLFLTFIYAFAIMLGYFVTSLYYRMSKLFKIVVSVGVGASIMVIYPLVDYMTNGLLSRYIMEVVIFISGIQKDGTINIFYPIIFSALGFIVLSILSYITTRRAPIKE